MQMIILVMGILAALILGNSYGRLIGTRNALQRAARETKWEEETIEGVYQYNTKNRERTGLVRTVTSPVSGKTEHVSTGEELLFLIYPEEDKICSPVNGRISKVYPMGNEFLLQADFGVELHLCVGSVTDDLMGCYYLPRVVPNEVVGQGQLLLEFERRELENMGQEILVLLELKIPELTEIHLCTMEGKQVARGEKITQLRMRA